MTRPTACALCPLHATARQLVWSSGPRTAEVMVVGEAPGHDEDVDPGASPFVGAAGRRLNVLLERAGLPRHTIYATNLVKHRPPSNRTPLAKEVKACAPHLLAQIEEVRPRVILALGASVVKWFDKGASLTKDHGKAAPWSVGDFSCTLVPMYHPAAALHNPNLWPVILADFAKLPEEMKAPAAAIPTRYWLAPREAEIAPLPSPVGFDLETTSPKRGGRFMVQEAEIVGYSLSSRDNEACYTPGAPPQALFAPGRIFIAHNSKFEVGRLRRAGIAPPVFEDTKIAAWLLQEPSTHLKALTHQRLGRDPITFSEVTHGRDMAEIPPEELVDYACADADNARQLWPGLRQELEEHGLADVYAWVERPLVPVLAKMEERGILLDRVATGRAVAFFWGQIHQALAQAAGAGVPGTVNIGSHDQLAAYLEKEGAPLTERTAVKAQLLTSAAALHSARRWRPALIDAVLAYKEARKLCAFAEGFFRFSKWDGALHPQFNQCGHMEEAGEKALGSPPGRLSCSVPNLQQVPHHGRGKGEAYEEMGRVLRRCLVARPGYIFVAADVGQQEPRITAFVAPEPAMLADFEAGVPIYAPMGEAIYGRPITKRDAQEWHTAKTFFLALVYGANSTKLMEIDPRLSSVQARIGWRRLTERYTGLPAFRARIEAEVKAQGYVRDWFGRVRWIPKLFSPVREQRREGLREAVNFVIQAPAASTIKLGMIRQDRELAGADAHLLLQVHDELVWEVREGQVDRVLAVVNTMLEGAMPIEFPVEVSVGRTWGDMERV